MSISSAISNAISGLTAVSRGTEVVSSNIANALTPGYARRELDLSPRLAERGGGVGLDGVSRAINAGLLADNRLAEADVGASTTLSTFHAAIERIFGTGTEASSLGQVLTAFDSALVSAASRPENEVRLGNVLGSATDLADKLNQISRAIQTERSSAEEAIRKDVSRLDAALGQVATLNKQIVSLAAQGKDVSALVDTRQAAIDGIAEIVPVKEVPRENGRIALFTSGGAILLDGSDPAWITFDSVPGLTPEMTVGNGALTRLSFNGKPLTEGQMTMFGGGTIGANFAIRDELAPACQRQIDAFARDLYDRLSATNVDPSLNAGGPAFLPMPRPPSTRRRKRASPAGLPSRPGWIPQPAATCGGSAPGSTRRVLVMRGTAQCLAISARRWRLRGRQPPLPCHRPHAACRRSPRNSRRMPPRNAFRPRRLPCRTARIASASRPRCLRTAWILTRKWKACLPWNGPIPPMPRFSRPPTTCSTPS